MPADDGDRRLPSADEQLVAEIIPLRRRASRQPDSPVHDDLRKRRTADVRPRTGDRSVWEPAADDVQLRRRPSRAAQHSDTTRLPRSRRAVATLVAGIVFAAAAALIVVALRVAPGTPTHAGGAQSHRVLGAISHGKQESPETGRAIHHTNTLSDAKHRGRHKPSSAHRDTREQHDVGRASIPSRSAGTGVVTSSRSASETTAAQSKTQPNEAKTPPATVVASGSTAQDNECVPGELGC